MRPMRELITPKYLEQQKWLHAQPRGYGGRGDKWAPCVSDLIDRFDARSVLDYGCGQGSLGEALRQTTSGIRISEYDPAIPGKDGYVQFADLVVCTDVLEHVEIDRVSWVLEQLKNFARKAVFLVVHLGPSNKTLPDGRNAHITQQPADWWIAQAEAVGLTVDSAELSMPHVDRAKFWIAVLTP